MADAEDTRRRPRQERSHALVDSILTAASRVLTTLGVERSTTTRIAERAGVSIGSLYQYFRDRDELFGELVERRLEENLRRFERELAHDASPLARIDHVVRAGLSTYLDERSLYVSLMAHAPMLSRLPAIVTSRRRAARVLSRYLREHGHESLPIDPDVAGFVLINAFMGVALMALQDDSVSREALHRELVRLFSRYLLGEVQDE